MDTKEFRRQMHRCPELSFEEHQTSRFISDSLSELGIEFRPIAGTGVLARVEGRRGNLKRCVVLRAEMDAVPIQEITGQEWASEREGVMHACGHDCHAASGLGLAKVIMQIKDRLKGTIKLIFQPAEEGGQGGKAVAESGIVDDVNFILSAHNSDFGENVDILPGVTGSMASRKCTAIFKGKSAHSGIAPHRGNNALLASATAVQNLHAIPRHGLGATRINVGKLVAGNAFNVIPDSAYMLIDIRGETSELN
jgi:aminobenzoyl-glutamate utilization protein A